MATPTNLPASATAGQVLTAQYVNDLRGAFRVLQVVSSGNNTTNYSNSTNTYANTFSVSITPSSTDSKILVIASIQGVFWDLSGNGVGLRIVRGGTTVGVSESINATASALVSSVSFVHLDSPATVASTTYTLQLKAMANAARAQINRDTPNSTSSIILLEISA